MQQTVKTAADQDPRTDRGLKQGLLAAFRRLLRPLVRILIRHGIAYGEFAEVAKTVFVETAAEDFALPGRKSSGSRIAILTGLTRKEVKRLTDHAKRPGATRTNLSRAGRVLAGWHSDPRFTGPNGLPLELPFDHDVEPSFTELVRRFSGDMPARAMLEELIRVSSVQLTDTGNTRVLGRVYMPFELDRESVERLGITLHDLADTLAFNLDPDREVPAKFERRVYSTEGISKKDVVEFHTFVASKGQEFLEMLDDWLSSKEEKGTEKDDRSRAGLGLYFFDEPTSNEDK